MSAEPVIWFAARVRDGHHNDFFRTYLEYDGIPKRREQCAAIWQMIRQCFEFRETNRPFANLLERVGEGPKKPAAQADRLFVQIAPRRFNFHFRVRQDAKVQISVSRSCRQFRSASTSAAGRAVVEPAR